MPIVHKEEKSEVFSVLEAKFWQHSPFGQATFKVHLLGVIFTWSSPVLSSACYRSC